MINKKGVSPLIAAVLLIAFTIALGAIVSTFLIKKTQEFKPEEIAQQSTFCEAVTLGYTASNEDGDERLIITTGETQLLKNLILINKGSFSIHELVITSPGFTSRSQKIFDEEGIIVLGGIAPGGRYTIDIQIYIDTEIGIGSANKEIKIVPKVKDPETGKLVICPDRQMVLDYTRLCKDIYSNLDLSINTYSGCPDS